MNEEDWAKIEAVPIYTEKDLANEFETFSTVLDGTNIDWNKRLKALKRLQGLIIGGADHLGNFPALMAKLSYHINSQLNDLRSAISKEACTVVCLAAKKAGESLEVFCDRIITKECLLKLINSANKITCEYGHSCVLTLLKEVKSYRVIPKVIDELSSKNAGLRQKVAEYIQIFVESYDNSYLEKYQTLLEGAISASISDANKDVRQITRKTFQMYKELYPQRADKMQANFDLSIQKALMDDGFADGRLSPQRKSYGNLTVQTAKQNQRPSSAMSGKIPGRKNDATPDQHEFQKTTSTFYTFNSEKADNTGDSKKKELRSAKTVSGSGLGDKSPLADKSPSRIKASEPSAGRFSSMARSKVDSGLDKIKTANSSPRIGPSKSFYMAENEPSQLNGREKRSTTPKKAMSFGSKTQNKSPRASPTRGLGKQQSMDTSISKKSQVDFYQSIKDEDLKFLLEKTSDDNWATRSNSFDKVNEFIADLKPDEDISTVLMNQLILAHIHHMNDMHYKVVVACQDSFSRLLTIYGNKILPYMDRIIPSLFINLSDGKERVSASTNFLLNLINKIYSGDELFPYFVKSLDHSNKAAYKTSMLEFMSVLIKNCHKHFSTQQAFKSCLLKVASIMGDFNNQKKILLPCLGMIFYLKELDSETTISTIATIKEPFFSTILHIMSDYAPDFEQEIMDYKGISKEPPKNFGRRSPVQPKRAKTIMDTSGLESPKKASLSFINEPKIKKTPSAKSSKDLNSSMTSGTPSPAKNKMVHGLMRSKEHTASNPCLTSYNTNKQKLTLTESSFRPPSVAQKTPKEENHKLKVMHYDFDDEDDNNPSSKPGLSFLKSRSTPVPRDEISLDLSSVEAIRRAIDQYPRTKEQIEEKISDVLSILTTTPSAQNTTLSERSLEVLRALLGLTLDFKPHTAQLISSVITLYHFPSKLHNQIDNIFKMSINLSDTEDCLTAMLECLEKEDHPILQILIKNITNLFLRNTNADLSDYLAVLFDKYYEVINHNNPDVRKNVVFSIVDLHFMYKEQIEGYLQGFSPSHQKLVEIYIQKRSEKQPSK